MLSTSAEDETELGLDEILGYHKQRLVSHHKTVI